MRSYWGIALMLVCVNAWAEDCHAVLRIDALVRQAVDGREVYVVAVADVKPDQCFKPVETGQLIKKLTEDARNSTALAEAYKQNQEALKKLNDDYARLVLRHEQALNASITLGENFDKNLTGYNKLVTDYDRLTVKFDELAGKYRDVALTSGSPISLELGAGLTSKGGGVALLGAGFNVYKTWDVKAWGMFHKDFSGILAGASFRF